MPPRPEFITSAQLFGRIGVTGSRRAGQLRPSMRNQMKKIKIKTATLPIALPAKFYLAAAAIVLALLAIPHIGHAQGIVRGAQEGSREGNRVARSAVSSAARSEPASRSEEHTSELQSRQYLVCRLLLEKKKK